MAGEPIIVDLGGARAKRIKDLKRGKGRLVSRVDQVIAEVSGHIESTGARTTQIVPIIVVYRKKRRKRSRSLGLFGW